ncbi:hypothetical protein [Pseudomonas aeruginosa]|uniref:hypothetical protein n=1 Tax=Pseudomonas aeruginosa TaxID=287 RepID=UPI00406C57C0
MTNELTDVRCPCGTEFPAESYDAGFIAGSGMCQNCDAALPPKDICTCPSGDGSLRHPCPAHPAPVEQAGGDERAAFRPAQVISYRPGVGEVTIYVAGRVPGYMNIGDTVYVSDRAPVEQPIAALAQPSPAQAEQAEPERPEVVAWQYRVTAGPQTGWSLWHPGKGEEFERSYTVERRPLMTVAQHERIVKAWIERWKAYIELSAKIAAQPGLNRNSGWNACIDELSRINGKTVSEGLLRGMAAFSQEIISGALEGGSFDGADIQESAERHGLIAKQMMREPCRGPEEYCACAWSTSFPTECYRITAELRALLSEQEGGKQ